MELRKIIAATNTKKCLRGIPTMDEKGAKFDSWLRHYERFNRILNSRAKYYSAFISRPDSAQWIFNEKYVDLLSQLWKDKDVVLVSEPANSMIKVLEMQAKSVVKIECPSHQAYAVSDRIQEAVLKTGRKVVLLCCGPAASCLAYRLSEHGVQAIDCGSMGGFILKVLNGRIKEPA
jgi:hypothetical protein